MHDPGREERSSTDIDESPRLCRQPCSPKRQSDSSTTSYYSNTTSTLPKQGMWGTALIKKRRHDAHVFAAAKPRYSNHEHPKILSSQIRYYIDSVISARHLLQKNYVENIPLSIKHTNRAWHYENRAQYGAFASNLPDDHHHPEGYGTIVRRFREGKSTLNEKTLQFSSRKAPT